MENILEISKLNKSYTDFSLTDVSFSLPDNSITGFIGVNGSGKTTTIRSILGLVKFNSGTIKLFGQDMNGNTRSLKERIGVVLDEGGFYEEFIFKLFSPHIIPAPYIFLKAFHLPPITLHGIFDKIHLTGTLPE